jgi:penicillin-binding protein 2
VVPEPDWKKRLLGQDWYEGDTINTAVGQGSLLVTPLQLARLYAAVGNGGRLVTPHLLRDSTARDLQRPLRLQPRTLETLRRSLREVVTSGTGTALASGLPPVAGKTGTAEDPPRPDHTWFVGFAPLEDPEVVVVSFAQNSGGFGGTVAAPIARQVLSAYFSARSRERTPASTSP